MLTDTLTPYYLQIFSNSIFVNLHPAAFDLFMLENNVKKSCFSRHGASKVVNHWEVLCFIVIVCFILIFYNN